MERKKRIFEIIQIGTRTDVISRWFDYVVVFAVVLNCSVLFLETFVEMQPYMTVLKAIEWTTVLFFCVEYGLRMWTAEYLYPGCSKGRAAWKFIVSMDGIVDLCTILPAFFLSGFVALRLLRVVRILRLFQINTAYDSFNVIAAVLIEKKKQIVSSVIIIFILMMASSLSMYSLEHEAQPEVFRNAFSGIWWSMSTIFTVGYGDIYPITTLGRILAVITTFLGVGAVAIPTGIISAGFVEHYTRAAQMSPAQVEIGKTGTVQVEEDSFYFGKTVEEVKKKSGITVVVIVRDGAAIIPNESVILREDDIIVFNK